MAAPIFETFWRVAGNDYFDIAEVQSLVEAGHTAVEVSAESQYHNHKLRMLQERWHRQAIERQAKYVAEINHRQSPEGQRQTAVRHAQMNPGGIVSGSNNPAFDELDQFGPDATNVFK